MHWSVECHTQSMQGICAITGVSEYVGSCVASRLANAGWEVRALCRRRSGQKQSGFTEAHFELGQTVAPQALAGADALVHLAYDLLPWRLVRLGLRILEDIGAKPPFRSDGILDLVTCDSSHWSTPQITPTATVSASAHTRSHDWD
jgi:NAD(P)-dependent dehydrogenase (short-subunit alcohol dehydrogenase family)